MNDYSSSSSQQRENNLLEVFFIPREGMAESSKDTTNSAKLELASYKPIQVIYAALNDLQKILNSQLAAISLLLVLCIGVCLK